VKIDFLPCHEEHEDGGGEVGGRRIDPDVDGEGRQEREQVRRGRGFLLVQDPDSYTLFRNDDME
jgi:hypothetical protein